MPDTCTTITLPDFAQTLRDDIDVLRSLDNIDANLQDVIDSPMPSALAWTLQKGGVETLDVSTDVTASSEERFRDYIESGAEALELNNLPKPHLADYYAASEIASQTGHDLKEVLETFEDIRPIELGVPSPEGTQFSADTSPVNLTAPNDQNVAQIDGADPQNFQEYDVHLMMYPLAHDIGGAGIETRPSHAFVVVVPKGTDMSDTAEARNALNELLDNKEALITRAGPDDGTYDFRPDTNIQSPTDNNRDGDVYAKDFIGSEDDLKAGGIRLIETTTINGDISSLREEVEDFRQFINSQDINYHAPYQNSNTYAGDVYEKLTGQEPPDAIQWPHYMPGLGNDLMNYEETEYANDFS